MIYASGMTDEPPEGCSPKFQPMEWAVILTDIGGRLYQVETTLWTEQGTERVVEYYVQPGDQKSRFQLYPGAEIGAHVGNILKVPSKAIGEKMVEILNEAKRESQGILSKARQESNRVISMAHLRVRRLVGDPEE